MRSNAGPSIGCSYAAGSYLSTVIAASAHTDPSLELSIKSYPFSFTSYGDTTDRRSARHGSRSLEQLNSHRRVPPATTLPLPGADPVTRTTTLRTTAAAALLIKHVDSPLPLWSCRYRQQTPFTDRHQWLDVGWADLRPDTPGHTVRPIRDTPFHPR